MPPATPANWCSARPSFRDRVCPANWPTAPRATAPRRRSSSSRVIRQAVRPNRAATACSRPSWPLRGKILNIEKGPGAQDVGKRGDQEHVHRPGRLDRHRGGQQGTQPRKAPLRQDHHHDRCRCGRQPHRHADADLLLPQNEAPHRAGATSISPRRPSTRYARARRNATAGRMPSATRPSPNSARKVSTHSVTKVWAR